MRNLVVPLALASHDRRERPVEILHSHAVVFARLVVVGVPCCFGVFAWNGFETPTSCLVHGLCEARILHIEGIRVLRYIPVSDQVQCLFQSSIKGLVLYVPPSSQLPRMHLFCLQILLQPVARILSRAIKRIVPKYPISLILGGRHEQQCLLVSQPAGHLPVVDNSILIVVQILGNYSGGVDQLCSGCFLLGDHRYSEHLCVLVEVFAKD